jgi:HAD superfamily phosphoserine phosphatase-like hydrolase
MQPASFARTAPRANQAAAQNRTAAKAPRTASPPRNDESSHIFGEVFKFLTAITAMILTLAKHIVQLCSRTKAYLKQKRVPRSYTPRASFTAGPDSPSVFVDLDGTLLKTEMGPTIVKFVRGLPNPYQRAWKTFLIPFVGIVAKVVSYYKDSWSVDVLAFCAIRNVSLHDAALSAEKSVLPGLHSVVRPHILAEIRRHQSAGRTVVILTGNFEPLVRPFCESLGCVCVGTVPEIDATNTFYTGRLAAPANLSNEKVRHVESTGRKMNELFGYGNSKSDIPFLAKTGNPYVVAPDRVLSRHASVNGWDDSFAAHSH